MRNKGIQSNIDNSDLVNFPNGRIKNDDGSGNGTSVNEQTKGDLHEFFDKMLRLYGIEHNNLPESEANGYQTIEALRAIASKNDFILTITSTTGILNVPVKLGKMLDNEQIVCKVAIDKTTETEIKGSDNNQYVVTYVGDFKANEYVRLIKTGSGVIVVRLVDLVNLDTAVSEYLYLKKANQTQEDAGTTDLVATTPLTNKTVFGKRVNDDTESAPYLATAGQNGIYPKAHFSIVAGLGASPIRNVGSFSGFDPGVGTPGALYAVSGDITEAKVLTVVSGVTTVECTMSNTMDSSSYVVEIHIESQSTFTQDTTIYPALFKPVSTTKFQVAVREPASFTQNLKMHLIVRQL